LGRTGDSNGEKRQWSYFIAFTEIAAAALRMKHVGQNAADCTAFLRQTVRLWPFPRERDGRPN
jgi:hypothetical protein